MTDTRISQVLELLCRSHATAALMASNLVMSSSGRFREYSSRGVVLEFLRVNASLEPNAECVVTFPLRNQTGVFVSRVLEASPGGPEALPHVLLELPRAIQHSESRMAFRVPIAENTLAVRARGHDGEWAPTRAINISLHGILIEFDPEADPELVEDQHLLLELVLGDQKIRAHSNMRRRDGHRYGLAFRRTLYGKEIPPPPALRAILALLEEQWRNRAG